MITLFEGDRQTHCFLHKETPSIDAQDSHWSQ